MIRYTYFDENNRKIAIVYKGTTMEQIYELQKIYDEVLFEEK